MDAGSFDPDGDPIAITETPNAPWPLGTTPVTLTVSDQTGATDTCNASVIVEDRSPPSLIAPPPPTLECSSPTGLSIDAPQIQAWLNSAAASDACGTAALTTDAPPVFLPACGSAGATVVIFTATDESGNSVSAPSTLSISDTTAPTIACNTRPITPKETPVSFTATAADRCGEASIAISGLECFALKKSGKRVDKAKACSVLVSGDTVTVIKSGGVGTIIKWTVTATDDCGNTNTEECRVEVLKPAEDDKDKDKDKNKDGDKRGPGDKDKDR